MECPLCDEFSLELETCEICHRAACPACLNSVDCCFVDAAEHDDDLTWAPPGWAIESVSEDGVTTYRRSSGEPLAASREP